MNQFNISNLTAYLVAIVTIGLGLSIMVRIIDLGIEPTVRHTFGVVLILMGIYRFAITRMKTNSLKHKRKILDDDE